MQRLKKYSKLFMKAFLERAIQGEMDHFLKEEVRQSALDPEAAGNSRNGYGKKTLSTKSGKVRIEYPRDRRGRFCLASFRSILGGLRASTIRS